MIQRDTGCARKCGKSVEADGGDKVDRFHYGWDEHEGDVDDEKEEALLKNLQIRFIEMEKKNRCLERGEMDYCTEIIVCH